MTSDDKIGNTGVPKGEERDHPEQYESDKKSLFDRWESERNVDPIPMEDLTIEKKEEQEPTHTKDQSSSPRKYHTGFEK